MLFDVKTAVNYVTIDRMPDQNIGPLCSTRTLCPVGVYIYVCVCVYVWCVCVVCVYVWCVCVWCVCVCVVCVCVVCVCVCVCTPLTFLYLKKP